ncbi:TonB C-terminal domain-containing protein [Novosphingobium profundi]|uniref:TonB C-terminal domain-containing protein n=1 Tax=Novosphingobium profundi TaxID=1774954 RepID=UPI001BDB5BBA|nr:TonB C-terminal domain-containing protein [Novosphingobium profundi]MBT0670888.1 TonB C-terminal domain-containing protein [Novosphingobium profundi]
MALFGLRKDEKLGLVVALVLHAGLLAVLILRPAEHEIVPKPQRIEVSISDEVADTSMSPDPNSQAAPDFAPTIGEAAPEAQEQPEPAPASEPAAREPAPAPRPEPRPEPKPEPKPAPKLAPKAPTRSKPAPAKSEPKPKPAAKPAPMSETKSSSSRRSSAIDDIVAKPSSKSASSAASSKASSTPKKEGGSKIGANFLDGVSGANADKGSGSPAATIGPREVSALGAAIRRQLKPHWQAPQGADAELLVTKVRFRLNRDGTLNGEPQILGTSGQTASNAAQVSRHQEQAIRAVKLAAPFNLPDDLYEGWKVVTTTFDRRL